MPYLRVGFNLRFENSISMPGRVLHVGRYFPFAKLPLLSATGPLSSNSTSLQDLEDLVRASVVYCILVPFCIFWFSS